MAKKKELSEADVSLDPTQVSAGASYEEGIAASKGFMSNLIKSVSKRFKGTEILTAEEVRARTVGIEPYSLAFQWFIECSVLPLQIFMQLAGPLKSYKSSALIELASWFMPRPPELPDTAPNIQGSAMIMTTEGKYSSGKVYNMLGKRAPLLNQLPCQQVEEWMKNAGSLRMAIHKGILVYNAAVSAKASELPDAPCPIFLGIDSVAGAQTGEMNEKVDAEGSVGRAHQDRPLLLSTFLASNASRLTGLPLIICLTNHEKVEIKTGSMPSFGPPKTRVVGGDAIGFHCALDIRVSPPSREKKGNREILTLYWELKHSSYGTCRRKLPITYVEEGHGDDKVSYFDWDTTLVKLLLNLQADDAYDIRSVLEIVEMTEGKYGCERVGVSCDPKDKQKLTAQELGRKIQADPVVRAELQKALGLYMYPRWTPEYRWTPGEPEEETKPKKGKAKPEKKPEEITDGPGEVVVAETE